MYRNYENIQLYIPNPKTMHEEKNENCAHNFQFNENWVFRAHRKKSFKHTWLFPTKMFVVQFCHSAVFAQPRSFGVTKNLFHRVIQTICKNQIHILLKKLCSQR